jgi:membrane protein YdbS with pleckstrin-like domain
MNFGRCGPIWSAAVYSPIRNLLLRMLRVPSTPPEPPPGSDTFVRTFRASRRFLQYRLVLVYTGALVALLAEFLPLTAGFFTPHPIAWIIAGFVAVMAGLALFFGYFVIRLEYEMRHYILTDRSLRIRQGAWIVRESTLTFANVQNIRIVRGPLQQLFGIADVIVDTAGGGSGIKEQNGEMSAGQHRGAIRGIENAPEVRDLILRLLKQYKDAGLGDPEDHRRQAAPAEPQKEERLREILDEIRGLRTALVR